MRMALGFLLLFGGAMLGYAVLSGKFPNANAAGPAQGPSVAPREQGTEIRGSGSGGHSSLGIPTPTHTSDQHASHGGF